MVQGQALNIGALARRTGLRPSAIRYYERRGILPRPQRMANGYRVYGQDALVYLRMVRQAQALGITLKEARELIQLAQHRQRPCERVRTLVGKRLQHVDKTIKDLTFLRGKLKAILKETAEKCPPTELCPLLASSSN